MITRNTNNEGLFTSIETAAYTKETQIKQNGIALFYFVKDNNEDEAEIYTASDILFKDANNDCGVLVARILATVERYHQENLVLSLEDMKSVMGRYVADSGFSNKSIEFAKEAIKGYEAAVKSGSRIIMLPIETYASALK